MNKLSRRTIFILSIRTLFIRLFYNYNNLFGEGLCYCLLPFSKISDSFKDNECLIKKHLKFFNTNEYFSGFALGIIMNLEEKKDDEVLDRTKTILSSAFGSIGDHLIYKLILPIMVLIALNKYILSGFTLNECTVNIVISEIIAFNVFNFSIRYFGIKTGYEKGIESIRIFKSDSYRRITFFLKLVRNALIIILIINLFIFNNILLCFSN